MVTNKIMDMGYMGFIVLLFACCAASVSANEQPNSTEGARVLAVSVSGNPGSYRFSVELASPDLGCQQYADWWEVLSENGTLLYRRVLFHSHVNEQPFTRSGGPVKIQPDEFVWVRGHMNTTGYGTVVFHGSVDSGFQEKTLSPDFASGAAQHAPLPDGCAF